MTSTRHVVYVKSGQRHSQYRNTIKQKYHIDRYRCCRIMGFSPTVVWSGINEGVMLCQGVLRHTKRSMTTNFNGTDVV